MLNRMPNICSRHKHARYPSVPRSLYSSSGCQRIEGETPSPYHAIQGQTHAPPGMSPAAASGTYPYQERPWAPSGCLTVHTPRGVAMNRSTSPRIDISKGPPNPP